MSYATRRRAASGTAAFALCAASLVAGAATARADCATQRLLDAGATTWQRLGAPRFEHGEQRLVGYGVDPRLPERIYVTNGVAIGRTLDDGCHWRETFAIPSVPAPDRPYTTLTTRVLSVQVADSGNVYALLDDPVHPRVVESSDAGVTWTSIDAGIGPSTQADRPPRLAVSPADGTLLVLTHPAPAVAGAPSDDIVYVTTDDGSTWYPMPPATATLLAGKTAPSFADIVAETPIVQTGGATQFLGVLAWAATDRGLYATYNGGQTWQPLAVGSPNPMAGVALRGMGATAELAMWEQAAPRLYVSPDGGTGWNSVTTPDLVESTAFGTGGMNAFVGTHDGRILQLDPATLAWRALWPGVPRMRFVATTETAHPDLYACTCDGTADDAVWRRTARKIAPPPPAPKLPRAPQNSYGCMSSAPKAPPQRDWGTPALVPAKGAVQLAPGGRVTVPVTLHLPPQELDLFLLTDEGPRSLFTYCPSKYGQIHAVAALSKIRNLRAGAGEFGDYPSGANPSDALFYPTSGDFVYLRAQRVGPVDQSLYESIRTQRNINENGAPSGDGGGMESTYQAVTGAGRLVSTAQRSPYDIPRGLSAGFAPDAYKLVLVMTGERFSTVERRPGYLGADFPTTRAALRAAGVHFAGVWMDNGRNKEAVDPATDPSGQPDLVDLAKASGTFSPRAIDCQEDSFVDVHPGDPMVCDYVAPAEGQFMSHDATLGDEVIRMVSALENRQPVTVGPLVPGEPGFSGAAPAVYPDVELLRGATLGYGVTLRCDAALTGTSRRVTLAARIAGRVVATADVLVSCPLPVPPPPRVAPVVPPIPPVPVPNPLPHPGPNPGQAPEVAPNPMPNPAQAPQAQAQTVAHGVPVVQQQKEPQLAFARAANRLQEQLAGEHPMSRPRSRLPAVPAGALLATCLAGALAYVSRSPAHARRR